VERGLFVQRSRHRLEELARLRTEHGHRSSSGHRLGPHARIVAHQR
jgi:hypothetical protein